MELTLSEAADKLGVSNHEAHRLARTGRLQVVRTVGRSILVDDTSVTARRRNTAGRGRRWNANTTWASIELLQYGNTTRLTGTALSRQKARLRTIDTQELVHQAAQRSTTLRCSQTRRSREALTDELLLSGTSALTDTSTASAFGLATGSGRILEGYTHSSRWKALRDKYGLVVDAEGDVVIHVSEQQAIAGLVTTALDLIDRGSAREKSAGEEFLARTLRNLTAHQAA